jgi:hypothetical protein
MEPITITIPAIDPAVIEAIQTETTIAEQTEIQAIRALRERFTALAKHAGYIRIGHIQTYANSRQIRDDDFYFERDGRRVNALLAADDFGEHHTEQFRGVYEGARLYLTERGEWLHIERTGRWSQWQDSPAYWSCGEFEDADDAEVFSCGGNIAVLTDEEVADIIGLREIAKQLGTSLATMATKLPERLTRIRQRTQLATELLAAMNK